MILTPAEYRQITPTDLFTPPPNPGILVPNPDGTAAKIASAENTHHLTKKIYLETLLLERTFIQQIIKAIDNKYIAALCNPINGKNYTTRPGHPWVPAQQIWTHRPATTWRQDKHCPFNALQSGPNNWHHIQLHRRPGLIHKISWSRINSESDNKPRPCYPQQAANIQRRHTGVKMHQPGVQNIRQF